MRRTFLTWLLVLIITAFVVTGGVTYWFFTNHAKRQAEQSISTRLHDLLELVDFREQSMQRLVRINDVSALARARAVARIIRLNPDILMDQEGLQGICNDLGAEQLAVTNRQGNIIASIPASIKGSNISHHPSARQLSDCLHTPGVERIVRPLGTGSDNDLLQVGVHRLDDDGLIRLGFLPYHEYRARESSAFGRLAANYRLGSKGQIIAFYGGAPLNREALPCPAADLLAMPADTATPLLIRGQQHFAYTVEKGNYRLVGILPEEELYEGRMRGISSQLITNSIVFLTVFALLSFLLQRYVIRGLARVNSTLRRIADGKLDERVDVSTSPEFVKLSTGINSMLDSLKVMGDREQERLRKELDMARFIQRNALPAPLPAKPDFELCADLLPATNVGGDFYDHYLSRDGRLLSFLVAEVSDTGVPAAMLMMRSLSILHSLARSGSDPATVAQGANRALCEGRAEDLHVSLFYASLNLTTGRMVCVNAGHSNPLIQHMGQQAYTATELPSCPPLGLSENSHYENAELQLEPGDRLFLCSQGLLRAHNPAHESFGAARLSEALVAETASVSETLHRLRGELRRFTEGRELEDDATLFLLEFQGLMRRGGRMDVRVGDAQGVSDMLSHHLEAVLAAPLDIAALHKATEDILAALPPGLDVCIALGCSEERAELSFTYPGTPFNPLDQLELPEMESCIFSYSGKHNLITLSKKLG